MKHKWLIGIFALTFIVAILIGLGLRWSVLGHVLPAVTDSSADSNDTPDLPITDSPAVVTEPVATQPESVTTPATTAPPETEPPITEPEPVPEEPKEVRICIGGDTSIDSEFADFAKSRGVDYPWAEISEVMNGADIAIVNLETCVSERGVSEKREGYGFRTPPEMLEGFKNAGIDAVNLANNHTRDFGYDALLDTFDHLTDYGIEYFGAGHDLDEACGLKIIEKNGLKIGLTGANRISLKGDCSAAEGHAGINQIGDMDSESVAAYLERIKEYDSMCDVLLVFLHAGIEETFNINSYQKEMTRALIDAGADIVVGGHSHTLQPLEFYNGKLIIYSIGNLIFWHIDDEIDGLTAVFDLTVDENGFVGLKLHPLFIKNYKVYYLVDGEGSYAGRYSQIITLMNELCNPYGIAFDQEGNMIDYVPQEVTADENS